MGLALALAGRNLKYKRDVEAEATLDFVRSKLWLARLEEVGVKPGHSRALRSVPFPVAPIAVRKVNALIP